MNQVNNSGLSGLSGSSQNFVDKNTIQPEFIENHRTRKAQVKYVLKKNKEYRKKLKAERYNFAKWFDRVKKSSEYGRKIFIINEENNYNAEIKYREELEEIRLASLIKVFGEEIGKIKHEKHLNLDEKRSAKKYNLI